MSIADGVRFDVQVTARAAKDGVLDFRGPLVHGKRGERFLYISWGTIETNPHKMFRRLKLYLGPLTRAAWSQTGITWDMVRAGRVVSVKVSGRGPDGTPHCGTAHAPWSLETATTAHGVDSTGVTS